MEPNGSTRIVLVTGASRGTGAEVARHFARPGTHVIVHCRSDHADAELVAEQVRSAGGEASTFAADIADEAAAAGMLDAIARRFGRLDALILNASSLPEADAGVACAMRSNREAQRRLARLALPLMPAGAHIVFVTSHQAHFYPHKAVPKGYAAIAASKRAGETTLYAMKPEFDRRGVHFTVVSGDLRQPPRSAVRRAPALGAHGSRTSRSLASVIAQTTSAARPSGIVYVGGTERPAGLPA
ncbi:SDR family oxidoreductase [Mycobacterium sp. ACS4331]|uniref:SDR family oxidoreductase n=1 Tax=Mycobacterium sp. ACS4331 TaxID=1834121 RepID=UPI000800EBA3|nr:SDR family oxidoreductase [Mycobacterium sp. ACS4331]OBF11987.1 short-chain dehydrogenase [Mycobacterium sp. ACS4331]